MSLSLAASADGLSLDLKVGSTIVATFSASGIEAGVLLADAATAQGLTNAKKAISPAMLAAAFQGANQSLAASGYQKLPGGLILQWGTYTTSGTGGNSVSITFPITFPNAVLNVTGSARTSATTTSSVWQDSAPTLSGAALRCGVISSPAFWFAIGN